MARPPSITALRGYAAAGSSNEVRRNAEQALHRLGVAGSPVKVGTSATIPAAAGTEWAGFRPGEFGRNPGTRWRSAHGRESLAPILTRDLRHRNEYFMSFGVERTPEIHFALAPRYKGDETSGFTASKLVVYAHGPTEQAPGIELRDHRIFWNAVQESVD